MTSLLAIDAATEACSVALLRDGAIREDFRLLPRAHTRYLLPMVDEMLSSAGIGLSQLDGLVFTAGPGSFTGLRVAIATVQGLAFAADLPVLPVSTLASMAQHYLSTTQIAEGGVLMPILDARMDELYVGRYVCRQGIAEPLCADALMAPEAVADLNAVVAGLGEGWSYVQRFGGERPATIDTAVFPHAASALTLAERDYRAGKLLSAEQAQPVYLRDSVAWQKSS